MKYSKFILFILASLSLTTCNKLPESNSELMLSQKKLKNKHFRINEVNHSILKSSPLLENHELELDSLSNK